MRSRWTVAVVCALLGASSPSRAVDLDRSLGVQGMMMTSGGTPASGTYNLEVRLFAAQTGGSALWSQTLSSVAVSGGLFDVTVGPVPAPVLDGYAMLWLETAVDGTALPRQPLRAVAYALVAQRANDLACSGCVDGAELADGAVTPQKMGSGTYGINISGNAATASTAVTAGSAATLTGAIAGDVTGTQGSTTVARLRGRNVATTAPTSGQVLKYDGTNWAPADDAAGTGSVTSVGTGNGLTGGPITGAGTIDLRLNGAGGLSKTLGAGSNELGIAAAGIGPSMVASGTYGISVTGNAATATSATSFTGPLVGDVTGTQGATVVGRLAGRTLSSAAPAGGQVLKYNAGTSQWEPSADAAGTGTVTNVTTGAGLSGGPITTTGAIDLRLSAAGGLAKNLGAGTNELGVAAGGITPSMVANGTYAISVSGNAATATTATSAGSFTGNLGGDVTGAQGTTTVARIRGRNVASTTPSNGQVLKYNASTSQWEPQADDSGAGGSVQSVATGAGLSGGPITSAGTIDLRLSTTGGLTKGLGAGTNELGIAAGGVVPSMVASGTYGVNISGNAATATTATSATTAGSAASFTGALAGDVTGTQGATTVQKIKGVPVAGTPTAGQVLKYNGSTLAWEPSTDTAGTGTVTTVNTGSGLSGGPISTTGTVDLRLNASGGLVKNLGTGTNELGIGAGGVVPSMVASGTYGISISGNAATATTATSATNATNATTAVSFSGSLAGDVAGTQGATSVQRIRGVTVATTAPTSGQVMKFNGSQWAPATDTAGTGTVTTVNTGAGLSGGPITGAGTVDLRLNASGGLVKNLGTGTNELGIGAGGVVPSMVAAGTYGINISGSAASATTAGSATTATSATSFTGSLGGDVAGTQAATSVQKIRGVTVATTAPLNGQVLKYNSGTGQWVPSADNSSTGVSAVTASAPLASSGGASPNISLSGVIGTANGGTGTASAPTAAGQFLRSTGAGAWGVAALAGSDIPGGSGSYIQNTTTAQAANFNITGNGTVGGSLTIAGVGQSNSSLRAPIFYDTNNTGYYVDPASASQFSQVYANDWFRPQGQTGIYFQDYGGGWHMTDTTWIRAYNGKGLLVANEIQSGSNVRAPIFYDLDNGGYYVNPNGTTQLNYVLANDWFRAQGQSGFYFQDYGGGWRMTDGTWIRAYGDKALWVNNEIQSTSNVRAPIFYDLNDGGYYADPNGTSRLNALYPNSITCMNGYCPSNYVARLTPNLHLNASQGYAVILNWDNGAVDGGTWQFRIGNGQGSDVFYVRADGLTYAPQFRDLNDGGYYMDPNGYSQTHSIYANNWFRAQGQTGFYFESYGGGWWMLDSTWLRAYGDKPIYTPGTIRSDGDMRAPIYYDQNDTGWYVDPNGTSHLYNMQFDGRVWHQGSCPSPFTTYGATPTYAGYYNKICMWLGPTGNFQDAQQTCFAMGGHNCTYSELYMLQVAYGTTPAGIGLLSGEWIGNRVSDDTALCVNNTGDRNNFEGHCNKNDGRWFNCCYTSTAPN